MAAVPDSVTTPEPAPVSAPPQPARDDIVTGT
jgi:hypothetical protein